MGCTSSVPEDEGSSRSRGYSTMTSKAKAKSSGKVKDGREESIEENIDFVHAGMTIKAAWVSRRGYYQENPDKDNQDSLSFIPAFGNRPNQSFFAVYDGHGKDGHVVSRFCAHDLPSNVKTGLDHQVLRRDGSNAVVRGVVQAARRLSGSFISAKSAGSSSNSLGLGDVKLERVDSRGSSHSPNIIYEDAMTPSSHPGHIEYNGDGSPKDAILTGAEVNHALVGAHLKANENLKSTHGAESSSSGTTSISMLLRDGVMYVSNVGDSRAVMVGRDTEGKVVTTALSHDQTPYRKDERERVRKTGARVMSMDQMDGLAPISDNGWGDITLGEDIDESGDPPRVWHPEIMFPGCAFTRSLGDLQAKSLGVIAEPEILERKMDSQDRYYVLASDGVFEFITNKTLGDLVSGIEDPLEACKEIAHMAYDLWLANEIRTDDITIIVLKVLSGSPTIVLEEGDSGDENDNGGIRLRTNSKGHVIIPGTGASDWLRLGLPQSSSMKLSMSFNGSGGSGRNTSSTSSKGGGIMPASPGNSSDDPRETRSTLRDYRTRLSYQIFGGGSTGTGGVGESPAGSPQAALTSSRKRPSIDETNPSTVGAGGSDANDQSSSSTYKIIPKSSQDTATIATAISNNFLFQYLNESQRKSVLDRMTPIDVKTGDVIIAQGGRGAMESNHFYVVDSGRYSVTQDSKEIHVYVGDRATGRHPGFGELSLLYDKPRAASVTAVTDGRLFALSREVFKDVLIYSVDARRVVFKCLRSIPRLQCLNQSKVETLSNIMARKGELKVCAGEVILAEAERGTHFSVIISGQCDVYNKDENATAITTRASRPLQHGLVLHRGYTFGITALTSSDGNAGLEGFKIVARTDTILYRVTKANFEAELGPLENLQKQFQNMRTMQRRPSAVAPPSLDDVVFMGLSFADETSRLSIGSFRAQIKGRANVSVMSFILSEVEANKLQGRVQSTLESCRMITANLFSAGKEDEYYKQSEAFLPKIINTYRHPNALHILFDRPIICSLLSVIQNPTLEKIPLQKDSSVGYIMGSLVVALQSLHKMGILYRSLHPEGIMVDDKGRLQLFDFGLSKADGVGGKSFTICGIANYLAPEMVFHQQPHNEAVDLWSLGVLLHELICGDFPFAGETEIATYSKIAAYAQCKSENKRIDMLPLQRRTELEKAASPLVEALLNPNPSARLGMPIAGDRNKGEVALRKHTFFSNKMVKTDLNRILSMQSPLMARLVKEKEIIAANATDDTHSLLELFFAETAISSAEKASGSHWLDELA